jgi:phosphoribosyl 1,2-cyclic phosphodiesterase
MQLRFLGTKANIGSTSRRHRRHSSLVVRHQEFNLRLDCGEDWLGRVNAGSPDAIVLTHAHPDHAFGLRRGAPCPVWGTEETWKRIAEFPIGQRRVLTPGRTERIGRCRVTPLAVEHSIRAPAVGLRISTRETSFFYAPDVVSIPDRAAALRGAALYIGDASSITRSLVRRTDSALVGHTTIRAQIGWCAEEGVPRALFTHCGSEVVDGDERTLGPKVRALGAERGVEAALAYDGLEVELPRLPRPGGHGA